MKATATWQEGYVSRLEDDRGHAVTVDLSMEEGGTDRGTSSLELSVLSLAGCITTIFALVAERRRLVYEAMEVRLDAARPKGSRTITAVNGTCRIVSAQPAEEVDTALRLTLRTCPVGVLFEQAHIPVRVDLIVVPPEPTVSRAAGPVAEAL